MAEEEHPITALIKLDGTIIKSDGSTYKSKFFNFLDIKQDDYSDIAYAPEEARKIRSHLMHLSTGASAAVPLICGGTAKCPFATRCPFVKLTAERKQEDANAKSLVPIGRQCLVELNLLNEWTRLYIQEYEIDEKNFSEFQMARELAEIELMLWRVNNNLAKPEHAELIQEAITGVDHQGNALTRSEPSSLMEMKEKLWNRKARLIKLMVGDRQEKYKRDAALRRHAEDDASVSAAQLHRTIKQIMKQAKTLDMKVKAAEGRVIEASDTEVVTLSPEDLISGQE